MASQAAQKACCLLHQKSIKKSHRPTEKYQQFVTMLKSLQTMLGIVRLIKMYSIYVPISEQYSQWNKYQGFMSKTYDLTFLLPSSLKEKYVANITRKMILAYLQLGLLVTFTKRPEPEPPPQ